MFHIAVHTKIAELFIHSFIHSAVFRNVHSLFQSKWCGRD